MRTGIKRDKINRLKIMNSNECAGRRLQLKGTVVRIRGGLKDKYGNDPLGFCRAILHHAWNPENPP